MDPNTPASQWTSQQKEIYDAIAPAIATDADKLEDIGRHSNNPIFEDFAVFTAQYNRAYAKALPTYVPADNDLATTAAPMVTAIIYACNAVGG
jgi:hypothetical protein